MSGSSAAFGDLIEAGLLTRGGVSRRASPESDYSAGFFGLPALDRAVPAGLGRSLHMIESTEAAGDAAGAGFVVSILIKLCSIEKPAVWISQTLAEGEEGQLYGPGLCALAIDPAALILVRVARPRDVLWAMEEALRSAAVSAVVGEMRNAEAQLDLTTTRRLALRSETVPAFLLVAGQEIRGATAAQTRWRVSSAPGHAGAPRGLIGPPAWNIELKKNKKGRRGRFTVGLDPETGRLREVDGRTAAPASSPPREGGGPPRGARVVRFPDRPARAQGRRP